MTNIDRVRTPENDNCMKLKKLISIVFLLCCTLGAGAGEWQWSVRLTGFISPETNREPTAFLWVPSDCRYLRAVMVGKHNMSEETLFEMPRFRRAMAELGIGLIWITPGIDQEWDVTKGTQKVFDRMMNDLAEVSGYTELKQVPVVPIGHSAMATYPWNFAARNPERTLAIVSLHGDAPRTNLTGYGRDNIEWGRTRNIDGIPGLMIEGEYEWWEARVTPALAFRMMYPRSCISFLCDTGRGHFDVAEETADYIALFLKKALEYRLLPKQSADKSCSLKKLNPEEGWLAERWRCNGRKRVKAAPYREYKGDVHDAFWYFDKEIADLTEDRYARYKGKKEQFLGFMQNGRLVEYDSKRHAGIIAGFQPEADGITFHLKAVFTDSLRSSLACGHAQDRPEITRICGPVEKVNDTTFTLRFYRMGMDNPRRTGDIWLLASSGGDGNCKSAVQQVNIRIPYRNTEGRRQHILFPGIDDVRRDAKTVPLRAVSDIGLPVYYYVKEGPAEIRDDKLVLTTIPPRTKFPVKVTVVAWQYGIPGKVQTAEPVERSFFICQLSDN